MKQILYIAAMVLLLSTSLTYAGSNISWCPRTPAGGAYTDPGYYLTVGKINRYGESAFGLTTKQKFFTNYTAPDGTMIFGGQIFSDDVGAVTNISTGTEGSGNSLSITTNTEQP